MSDGARKDMQLIEKEIRKAGYKTIPGGAGHKKIVDKRGVIQKDKNGPLLLSSTPSDFRARDLAVTRLIRAGILKENPWIGKTDVRANREPTDKERRKAAVVKGVQKVTQRREEETRKLRGRMEPFVAMMGGWRPMIEKEIVEVSFHLLKTRGWVGRWPTPEATAMSLMHLKKGDTLSDKATTNWFEVLNDIERSEKPKTRFFELLREARGLKPAQTEKVVITPPGQSLTNVVPLRPQMIAVPGQQVPRPTRFQTPGRLALETVALILQGREQPDVDRALMIGEEILRLELTHYEDVKSHKEVMELGNQG